MKTTTMAACAALALLFGSGCGGSQSVTKSPSLVTADADGGSGAADAEADAGKTSMCTGADIDLLGVLIQSACEVPNAARDAKLHDVSSQLEVSVMTSQNVVPPGGHADVTVTFTNKSSSPLVLDFLLDPTPRFRIEAYTSTKQRAEMPKTPHPVRKGVSDDPAATSTAEVTITPGGKASARLDWSAVRLKWAPELVKGTPIEQGYPTAPAGPLAKGKYTLKIVTPLVGVFEGADHEISTAKTTVMVQ
jgi:hypothetical protein